MDRVYRTIAQYGKYAFKHRNDDDWADRLNYVYSCVIFVIFSIVIGTRQYLGDTIICWTPAQFTAAHVRYTNNLCWIQNTYFLPRDTNIPAEITRRDHLELGYYQWIPFVLVAQAITFYLPHLLWKGFSNHQGFNIKIIVRTALETHNLNPEFRQKTVKFLARHIEHCLDAQREYRTGCCVRVRHILARFCCIFVGGRYGNKMTFMYLSVKIWYVINTLGNLVFLNKFLETNYTLYGIELLIDLHQGNSWRSTGLFPRITMCDFEIRVLGNIHRHTIQCVLPTNMFNEKMYLMVWFWLLFSLMLTSWNLFQWASTVCLASGRLKLVKKYLKVSSACSHTRPLQFQKLIEAELKSKTLERFAVLYLRMDGAFLLNMIAKNAGPLIVMDIIDQMWTDYKLRFFRKVDRGNDGERRTNSSVQDTPQKSIKSKNSLPVAAKDKESSD